MIDQPMLSIPVGRFLIDLPEQAVVRWGRLGHTYAGPEFWNITDEPQDEIRAGANKHIKEIERYVPYGVPPMVKVIDEPANGKFVYFYLDPPIKDAICVHIHGYYRKEGLALHFRAGSRNSPEAMKVREDQLDSCFASARPRGLRDTPHEPGFCFEGGFLPGEPADRNPNEHAAIMVRFPDHPDVHLRFATDVVERLGPESGLLARRNDPFRIPVPGLRQLRSGERRVGPYRGEEVVDEIPERNRTVGRTLQWECRGPGKSAREPALTVDMMTGSGDPPVNSSLTSEETFALWDRILESIRYRVPGPPQAP